MTNEKKSLDDNIEKYKNLYATARKQLFGIINFDQDIIETYRKRIEENFLIRFPMLFLHEALQSGRGFLLLTKDDSINHGSGAAVLLRNGFESIVWGTSCLEDNVGPDLIGYIWNHQDMMFEKDMGIYKKWKLAYSEERNTRLEEAKKRLNEIVTGDNKFQLKGMPLRKSYSTKQIRKVFRKLVNRNGIFKYYFETSYKLATNAWHSSSFGMRLTQYEEVKHYFLGNVANGFSECLKVFSNEAIRKCTGTEDFGSLLYKGISESLKKQMERIERERTLKSHLRLNWNYISKKQGKINNTSEKVKVLLG